MRKVIISAAVIALLAPQSHDARAERSITQYTNVYPTKEQAIYKRMVKGPALQTQTALLPFGTYDRYSAVGQVYNAGRNKVGTAFVIDDYTLLTNTHLVRWNIKEAPTPARLLTVNLTAAPGNVQRYSVASYRMVKGSDVTIVRTKTRIDRRIPRLKIAGETRIRKSGYRTPVHAAGYTGGRRYISRGHIIGSYDAGRTLSTRMWVRHGMSGSPIINKFGHVVGIVTYTYRTPDGRSTGMMGNAEMSGGNAFLGHIRTEVKKYSR